MNMSQAFQHIWMKFSPQMREAIDAALDDDDRDAILHVLNSEASPAPAGHGAPEVEQIKQSFAMAIPFFENVVRLLVHKKQPMPPEDDAPLGQLLWERWFSQMVNTGMPPKDAGDKADAAYVEWEKRFAAPVVAVRIHPVPGPAPQPSVQAYIWLCHDCLPETVEESTIGGFATGGCVRCGACLDRPLMKHVLPHNLPKRFFFALRPLESPSLHDD
jgi:hypothetical protein